MEATFTAQLDKLRQFHLSSQPIVTLLFDAFCR